MRIALVITELYPGGAERCLASLAEFLQRQGHQVMVLSLWDLPRTPSQRLLVERLESNAIAVRSVHWNHWWETWASLRRLERALRDFRPEIVQSFLFHANVGSAWACRRLDIPLVGGARVTQPSRLRRLLHRWATASMHRLVCVSQGVANHCRLVEHISAEKLMVIPNGIDLPHAEGTPVDLAAWGLPREARVLLYVGRLDPQKGIVELSQRWDELLGQLPEHHVVILGTGPQEQTVQRLTKRSACGARVHLLGWVANPLDWMRSAEMLLLPTRYEGMPNVVMEAMAVGTPVVCFAVEGIAELMGEDEELVAAQIVPRGDFHRFVRAVHRLAADAQLRRRIGAGNRHRIGNHFSLEQQLQKYEQLYLSLLDRLPAPPRDT
ncbi:MAG: glycosyl transferase [Pirellulaceae bacterium]|nr:MAG: glycosyl transferase [Pirellulaceae bacterium]